MSSLEKATFSWGSLVMIQSRAMGNDPDDTEKFSPNPHWEKKQCVGTILTQAHTLTLKQPTGNKLTKESTALCGRS